MVYLEISSALSALGEGEGGVSNVQASLVLMKSLSKTETPIF